MSYKKARINPESLPKSLLQIASLHNDSPWKICLILQVATLTFVCNYKDKKIILEWSVHTRKTLTRHCHYIGECQKWIAKEKKKESP